MKDFPEQNELAELILKKLDASLSQHEFMRFQSLLKGNPVAIAYYVKTILTIADFASPSSLPFMKQNLSTKVDVLDETLWEALAEDEATAPKIQLTKMTPPTNTTQPVAYEKVLWSFKKSAVITILVNIAAMVLIILFIGLAPIRGKSFATVMEEYQSGTQGLESRFQAGQDIDDKPLKLDKGLLKIQMTNGAEVVLEAPTEVRLESDDQLFLIQGKLTASVPKQAIGFTVRTPSASIIDYGTEFGVTVDRFATTEAHVLKGNVKIGLGSNPRVLDETIRLSANQAGCVSGQTLYQIPVNLSQFVYDIPTPFERAAKSLGVAMYLQLQGDNAASLKDIISLPVSDIRVNPNLSVVPGPLLGNGKRAFAIRVQGSDSAIRIDNMQRVPQSRDGAYSIGYWVRFDDVRQQIISANRIDTAQGSHFRSVVMTPEGFLQHLAHKTTLTSGWRIVTAPEAFQPGKWYFIVVTRGVRGDNAKKIYVNGKCVTANFLENGMMELDNLQSFQFGGDIGEFKGFEGELSEILFFPRELDEKEVQGLYEAAMNNV
jgi:hypothetical protein